MNAQIACWRRDPVAFVRETFGAEPDRWQIEALEAFGNPAIRRISLQACAGPGKTALLAWCGLNFLGCQADVHHHPNGAAVSITDDNLRDNLWKEFAHWMARSAYFSRLFQWTSNKIFCKQHPGTWFLSARSWPKTGTAEDQGKTLSGLHSQNVLALIDESGGIPTTVLRAAEQALSTGPRFGKILQAGNPISLDGMLYAAATSLRAQWHVIRITGDPDEPTAWIYAPRVSAAAVEWAREQINQYGRDNPWVMSYILGQFPPASINALLGIEEVEAAMARHYDDTAFHFAQKRVGVDVARFGDDRTVLFARQGLVAFQPTIMRHARDSAVSVDIASAVMQGKLKWGSELEFFDATGGWAAGAVDILRSNRYSPVDVQFHAKSDDPRYANKRACIWFRMAEWVKAGGALPKIPKLVTELTAPTYLFKAGKFILEEKDQIKKRLGESPDMADALALTFGLPDAPGQSFGNIKAPGGRALTEFDPYRQEVA